MARAQDTDSHPYSGHFLRAIDWGLSVDEDGRPRNVAEFQAALTGEGPAGRPAHEQRAQPRRRRAFAVAAAVAILGALAAYLILAPDPQAPGATKPPVPAAIPEPTPPQTEAPVQAARGPAEPVPAQSPLSERAEPSAPAQGASSAASAPTPRSKDPALALQQAPAAVVRFDIVPRGEHAEIYVDGKRVGQAPPMSELKLPPGKHRIEIRGDKPPYVYYYWVEPRPGEQKRLWARFAETRQ